MLNLFHIYQRQKKYILFLLAACVLGAAFTPYSTIFAGIGLGAVFGLYNFWILQRRMLKFDRAFDQGKKRVSLGTGLRFASGIAAVAIALSLPEYFHLISTVIGLMIPYVLLVIEQLVFAIRKQNEDAKER